MLSSEMIKICFGYISQDVSSTLMKEHLPKGKRSLTSWFGWGSSAKPSTPKKEHSSGASDEAIQPEDDERWYTIRVSLLSHDLKIIM